LNVQQRNNNVLGVPGGLSAAVLALHAVNSRKKRPAHPLQHMLCNFEPLQGAGMLPPFSYSENRSLPNKLNM